LKKINALNNVRKLPAGIKSFEKLRKYLSVYATYSFRKRLLYDGG